MRANRIGQVQGDLRFLCETNLDRIDRTIEAEKPEIESSTPSDHVPGGGVLRARSVSQVRESTSMLIRAAKTQGIAISWWDTHDQKAWWPVPRVLEHMVDTVLYFEGTATPPTGFCAASRTVLVPPMRSACLRWRSRAWWRWKIPRVYAERQARGGQRRGGGLFLEGTRPILLEVQALVAETSFGMPRRTAAGTDYKQVNLLMAVLESGAATIWDGWTPT